MKRPTARVVDPVFITKNVRSTENMPWMDPAPDVKKRVRVSDADPEPDPVGGPDAPAIWTAALDDFTKYMRTRVQQTEKTEWAQWTPATSDPIPDICMSTTGGSSSSSSSNSNSSSSTR
jgi:hypothetical protein